MILFFFIFQDTRGRLVILSVVLVRSGAQSEGRCAPEFAHQEGMEVRSLDFPLIDKFLSLYFNVLKSLGVRRSRCAERWCASWCARKWPFKKLSNFYTPLGLPQPKPPVFLFMSARSRKLGYAIFRAFHVPVFLRFLVIYPPGFVILCRIRSNRKERGG
jgi:hypothetical protein